MKRLTDLQRPIMERIRAGHIKMTRGGLYKDVERNEYIDRRSLAPLFQRKLVRLLGEYWDAERGVALTAAGSEALGL